MNRRQFLRAMPVTAPLLAARPAQAQQPAAPAASLDGWTPLFNGRNLDGWYTFSSALRSRPDRHRNRVRRDLVPQD